MSDDILTTMVSVPFAMAVTALLRRKWPQIDGAYVPVVVLTLSVIAGLLGRYRSEIPMEVWAALGPLFATILALGTDAYVKSKAVPKVGANVSARNLDANVSPVQDWIREHPTKKEPR